MRIGNSVECLIQFCLQTFWAWRDVYYFIHIPNKAVRVTIMDCLLLFRNACAHFNDNIRLMSIADDESNNVTLCELQKHT